MIRTLPVLAVALLAWVPAGQSQTAPNVVRIPIPRVQVQPIVPRNFINQNYVYEYPNGYVRETPLITLHRSQVPPVRRQNLSNDPDPADHLNGLLLSRDPRAQSNQLNVPARADVRYSNRLVADVQQDLRRLGYYTGTVDGTLGPETESAIQRYQVDHRQPVTGLLDRAMLSQLGIVAPAR
ncbi:MAG: peptidoglycan-binding protein [Verrucomicrobia bacterium]|nr:peptidoglycan-binding protein [Verrucomicrobiota bacterium]